MGFTDELKNKWQQPNNGLIKLIMINVIAFVVLAVFKVFFTISGNADIYQQYIYGGVSIPASISDFMYKPWTIVSYFFVHSLTDFFHILFNMLVLYWFGQIIVEFIGSKKLIALYILGGLSAGTAYLLMYNLVPYFVQSASVSTMVGASGSIYAIIVAAAVLTPDYRLNLLFIGPVKIKYIAGVAIFISFISTTGSNAGGEIAHLGGAAFGYLFITQLRNGSDWSVPVTSVLDFFANTFRPKPKMRVTYKKEVFQNVQNVRPVSNIKKTTNNSNQEVIDAILDKISESGYEKLTTEEKQILFNASKKK